MRAQSLGVVVAVAVVAVVVVVAVAVAVAEAVAVAAVVVVLKCMPRLQLMPCVHVCFPFLLVGQAQ